MKKILYVVLDGVGDRPCKGLDGRSPLEAASTPSLDQLARRGRLGLLTTVREGVAPESDVAVISLLGYDPHVHYTGRGPLESYAAGIQMRNGDLAFRVNFATGDRNFRIKDRRVGRNLTTEEAQQLAQVIDQQVKLTDASFTFKATVGHRGVLHIRAQGALLCGMITNTDPAYAREGKVSVALEHFDSAVQWARPLGGYEASPEAQRACALANEFTQKSFEALERAQVNRLRAQQGKPPGNLILMRDAGDRLPEFEPLPKKFGRSFGCIVEMPVEKGIALLTGMAVIEVPLACRGGLVDYSQHVTKVLEALATYEAVYVHLKGPDEPAHDGDVARKIKAIEAIDRQFFGPLLASKPLDGSWMLCVTADHATPCELAAHSDDPVPLLVVEHGQPADGLGRFTESLCGQGSLGHKRGQELLSWLVEQSRGKTLTEEKSFGRS